MQFMSGGHDAIVEDATVPAYGGAAGATRIERFEVLDADGNYRSMPLCTVVNAVSDPRLAERARAGSLHRLPDGRQLAVAFVYHDPSARRFALVLPAELAHTALQARARLLTELAGEHTEPVPAYVLQGPTVVGVEALEDYIEPPPEVDGAELREADPEDLDIRARQLGQREQDLAEQAQGLITMGEELTAREGALQKARTELEEEVAAHEEREQQLMTQLEALRHEAQVVPPEGPGAVWQEVGSVREVPGAAESGDATVVTSVTAQIATSEPPRAPRGAPPPLHHRSARPTPPPLHSSAAQSAVPPPLRPSGVDLDAVQSMPPPLPGNAAAGDAAEPAAAPPPVQLPARAPRGTRTTRSAEVDPPKDFTDLSSGWMALRTAHGELWLFAHVTDAQGDAFLRASDLLLQCTVYEGYPVVLLTLVGGGAGDQHILRLPLDGCDPAQMASVETLAQSFRVRVALYSAGHYIATLTVATLREGVAREVIDFVEQHVRGGAPTTLTAEQAVTAVMEGPPPTDSEDLPFGPARRQANSTVTVRAAVEQLASWMRPAKLQEATLIYSVPTHVVEGSARRVLRAAKLFGVALPPGLVEVAVDYNVVQDPLLLVNEQIEAFHGRLEAGDHLGEGGTRDNWDRLFAQAEAAGMIVDDDTRGRAERSIEMLAAAEPDDEETGEETVGNAVDPADMADTNPPDDAYAAELPSDAPPMPSAELKALLHDPKRRLWAIGELGQRGFPALVDPAFDAIEEMPATELPLAVAALLSFGEHAADRLQRGLDSDSAAMRHACALALGSLRLRRTLAPLLQHLDTEPTNVWVEIARALGGFGSGAVRSVVRGLPSAAHPERLMVVLAHLANHGAAAEVEKLENGDNRQVAEAARKAMARRSRLEWEDLAIREQRTLTDNHPAARFSQSFFSALRKLDN